MKNFTPEMIEKAKAAKSAQELLALAKENSIELTEEEAKAYFDQLNPKTGELSDCELDNVAGGGCGCPEGYEVTTVADKCLSYICKKCGNKPGYTEYGFQKCKKCGGFVVCDTCKYCEYKNGLWLCNKTRVRQDLSDYYK